jgi:hypothetical protein
LVEPPQAIEFRIIGQRGVERRSGAQNGSIMLWTREQFAGPPMANAGASSPNA